MIRKDITPAITAYSKSLADAIIAKKAACAAASTAVEETLLTKLSKLGEELYAAGEKLASAIEAANAVTDEQTKANAFHDSVLARMDEARAIADSAEVLIDESCWPFPTYGKLLYGV